MSAATRADMAYRDLRARSIPTTFTMDTRTMHQTLPTTDRLSHWFERTVVLVVQALLLLIIVLALVYLWILLWRSFADGHWPQIDSVPELQRGLQRSIAGVLLVVLALELREALRNYFVEHRVRVEVILSLARIAIGRHIIQ